MEIAGRSTYGYSLSQQSGVEEREGLRDGRMIM